MDCFLSEGMEVIFRIALSLLTMGKDELLLQDMEGVIRYFQKYMPAHFEANQEAVFKLAFELNINQKKMKKLEKEYTTMKTKEKEDEIEIRVSKIQRESHVLQSWHFLEAEKWEPSVEAESWPFGTWVQCPGRQTHPGSSGQGGGGWDNICDEEGACSAQATWSRHQHQAWGGYPKVRQV